eukprot:1164238-Alexandrium_andersonii.AAC.1
MEQEWEYSTWWDGCAPSAAGQPLEYWADYLTEIAKPQAWASALELLAISQILARPIAIYVPE